MTGPEARLLKGAAAILGGSLTQHQASSFRVYLDVLASWNRVHRLVGSSDPVWMVENVILDSLLFLRVVTRPFESLLDIGSGAGVPGIPIKIVRPDISLIMVESKRKRASFLASAIRSIGLSGASVIHGRAEALIEDRMRFDVVVARCSGKPQAILDLGSRMVSAGGMVVVAGSPNEIQVPEAHWMRVVNPATGSARNFVVRRASPRAVFHVKHQTPTPPL